MKVFCAYPATLFGVAALFATSLSVPRAWAGDNNPVFVVTGSAGQSEDTVGTIEFSWKSDKTGEKDKTVKISFKVGEKGSKAGDAAAVAKSIEQALMSNADIKKDWKFSTTNLGLGVAVTGKPRTKDVRDCNPGVINGRDKDGKKVLSYNSIVVAGTNDPAAGASVGTAFFNVFSVNSNPPTGQIEIGVEDKTALLSVDDKSIFEIKTDLVSELISDGLTQAFLSSPSGRIVVPHVTLGDPLNSTDIGPFFDNISSNLGGSAVCQVCMPEPSTASGLMAGLGAIVLVLKRRRGKAAGRTDCEGNIGNMVNKA